MDRRNFMQQGGMAGVLASLGALGWLPAQAQAQDWNRVAFEARALEDVLKALGGGGAARSDQITLTAPEIAEHGAVVPVTAGSRLPATEGLAILVEKNPNMLAALFQFPPGTLPEVNTRVKMAQTCNVFALARTGGGFFYTTREVKITLGGCGG